jgi:hypothetical protein
MAHLFSAGFANHPLPEIGVVTPGGHGMKKTARKLTLRRETVVALEQASLTQPAGGLSIPISFCRTACYTHCYSLCIRC